MSDTAISSPLTAGPLTVAELTGAIRDAIVSGDYVPNQRLIEADLIVSFGASRASIRTVLLELENYGLIDRLPNRGSRVRAISLDEAIEILEVRIDVEGLCVAKAAERISDAEIGEFRELRSAIITSVEAGNLIEYSRLNQLLDQRIREISGHGTVVRIMERLHAQCVRHQFRLSFQPGRAKVSGPEHCYIIDAVTARDPDAARAASSHHLLGVISALREMG